MDEGETGAKGPAGAGDPAGAHGKSGAEGQVGAEGPTGAEGQTGAEWPVRELTDASVMRALAHPVRMRLAELLTVEGPLTATECAERLGETPANCSFHLRTLAKHGFVEEAAGGTGRRRPWRAVLQGNRFKAGPSAPPHVRDAADLLTRTFADRSVRKVYEYLAHIDDYGVEWSDAALMSDSVTYLTPDELAEIGEQLMAMMRPYLERLRDPSLRPEGARPVLFFLAGVPIEPGSPTDA